MNLFKELGNDLRPENSKEALLNKEVELKAIAEEATSKVIDPESPHFSNYVLMYCLGYQDRELKERSNLLDHIKS